MEDLVRREVDAARPAVIERMGLVLAAACLCQMMVVLDASVVNVALPHIGTDLHFSGSALPWVVNAYLLTFGGLLLLGGRIADLVGHRRAMLWGLGLFGVTSVLGGLAQNPGELIAARAGQGLAAAVLAPISLTVIMVNFPEGAARARAVATWSMVSASGSALGVLLGGLLTEALNWRWVMFVNAPIVVVTAVLGMRSVTDRRAGNGRRPDGVGAVLVTLAMTALVYGTLEAGDHSWTSARTVGTLVGALVAFALFVLWEARFAVEPVVRLGIFRVRTVSVANLITLLIGSASISGFYFASLFLQQVLGYGPLPAGASFLPFCAGVVVGSLSATRLVGRLGLRATLTAGLLLASVGMCWFGLLSDSSTFLDGFLGPSIVASVGVGICMVANTSFGTTGVAPHEAGLVSGLLNAGRQCGGSVGLAVLSTIAVTVARHSGGSAPRHALTLGYDRAFLVTGAMLLVAACSAAVFVPGRSGS